MVRKLGIPRALHPKFRKTFVILSALQPQLRRFQKKCAFLPRPNLLCNCKLLDEVCCCRVVSDTSYQT
ncbi:hypothetical protein KIN20_007568 [Parelaphostrongylus tenuis]|uniref:Uncharacterized protein n=1 Tax=Parelaphostrongylus tenuis TaxID=148309 RepID=A0AAD5QK39_PARTN|nr:hypothetical protein KIN20_007568 [Parelaphostrongylus tenuis]